MVKQGEEFIGGREMMFVMEMGARSPHRSARVFCLAGRLSSWRVRLPGTSRKTEGVSPADGEEPYRAKEGERRSGARGSGGCPERREYQSKFRPETPDPPARSSSFILIEVKWKRWTTGRHAVRTLCDESTWITAFWELRPTWWGAAHRGARRARCGAQERAESSIAGSTKLIGTTRIPAMTLHELFVRWIFGVKMVWDRRVRSGF